MRSDCRNFADGMTSTEIFERLRARRLPHGRWRVLDPHECADLDFLARTRGEISRKLSLIVILAVVGASGYWLISTVLIRVFL